MGTGTPLLSQQYAALYLDPHTRTANVQEWSFGVQSQLAANWGLEVGYIGTSSHHLDNIHIFANQPLPGVGPIQPRRPYPDFNNISYFSGDADANYNALQVKLNKRFSGGLQFLTSYTYAKTMDNEEGNEGVIATGQYPQDDNNLRGNYGRAVSDIRHRLVFSPIWQLPVGRGRRFLDRPGLVDRILGGWEVSGILTLQSDFPFTVQSADDFSNSNSTDARPDRTCLGAGPQTMSQWFNPACFIVSGLQAALTAGTPRFGNSGRNILTGPGFDSLDFSLIKNFVITERLKLEFRAEAFNLTNTAHFNLPNATCVTTSSSTCAPGPQDVGDNIGRISGAGEPRDIQFGLKLIF